MIEARVPVPFAPTLATRDSLGTDLLRLGLTTGDTVLLHSSLRSLGFVVGGVVAVVHALLDVLGPEGTLVVPTMTADNCDPSRWAAPGKSAVPQAWWPTIREHLPAFDAERTPSVMMGAIAEAVRNWPGAIRSAHAQSSLTALGPAAARLTADHRLDCHLGPNSPLGRLAADDRARILLLGVGYDVCTAFHLGEYRWSGNDLRDYECVIAEAGRRRWYRYRDVRLNDSDFGRLGAALDAEADRHSVRRGLVAAADCRLLPFTTAVDFATTWFELNRPSRPLHGPPQSPPQSPPENA